MSSDLALKGQVETLYRQAAASEQEFCIDLEGQAPDGRPVWEWMGYSRKDNAKASLSKLIEGVDYLVLKVQEQVPHQGGFRTATKERILFSRDGFKQWGMMAGTDHGRQIRLYFIECEKRLQLGMSQPTALNAYMEQIAIAHQDLTHLVINGFNGVHSEIAGVKSVLDDHGARLARLEEQQCDQLYVFVRSSDLTIKLGYTQNLEERRKRHESRGFVMIGAVSGTRKRETEIKRSLIAKGFRPKNGDEEYHLSPEIVEAFAQEGLPIGGLCATRPKNALPRRSVARCEAATLPLLGG